MNELSALLENSLVMIL